MDDKFFDYFNKYDELGKIEQVNNTVLYYFYTKDCSSKDAKELSEWLDKALNIIVSFMALQGYHFEDEKDDSINGVLCGQLKFSKV